MVRIDAAEDVILGIIIEINAVVRHIRNHVIPTSKGTLVIGRRHGVICRLLRIFGRNCLVANIQLG